MKDRVFDGLFSIHHFNLEGKIFYQFKLKIMAEIIEV